MSGQSSAPASRRTRAAALVAGGALVVGGVGYTLASWTDTEWVFGGNGTGGPGIGTSTFEVEQNVTAALDSGWTQAEENPGQEMTFGLDGIALSPGDATYAGVRLRTVAGSIAGDVRMAAAETATGVTTSDPGELLWQALQVRVATTADGVPCGATAFTTGTVIADGPLASTEPPRARRSRRTPVRSRRTASRCRSRPRRRCPPGSRSTHCRDGPRRRHGCSQPPRGDRGRSGAGQRGSGLDRRCTPSRRAAPPASRRRRRGGGRRCPLRRVVGRRHDDGAVARGRDHRVDEPDDPRRGGRRVRADRSG